MALERELIARKHRVGREVAVRVFYKGPEARFYRVVHRTKRTDPSNQENPIHPDETSVSVASPPQAVTNVVTAGGPDPAPSSCLKNT